MDDVVIHVFKNPIDITSFVRKHLRKALRRIPQTVGVCSPRPSAVWKPGRLVSKGGDHWATINLRFSLCDLSGCTSFYQKPGHRFAARESREQPCGRVTRGSLADRLVSGAPIVQHCERSNCLHRDRWVSPKSAQKKKSLKREQQQHHRTDLSSIWRLVGPTFGTRKRRYFRETRQNGVPDRTLQFS